MVEQRTENPCVPGSIPGGTTQAANFTVGCFFCIRALMGISAGCAYKLRYGLRRCVVAFWSKVEAWQCRSRRGSERINVSALTTSQQSRFAADGQPLRLASEPLPLYRADARHRGRHSPVAVCGLELRVKSEIGKRAMSSSAARKARIGEVPQAEGFKNGLGLRVYG